MPTFRLTLAYDGTDFVGWQRQASGVSIQGLLEDALRELDDRYVVVTGAGRTDAGVHALGQVAGFALEREIAPEVLARALNARLPPEVRVLAAEEAPLAFNPRFESHRKTYRYRIWNAEVLSPFERRYAWHVLGHLDADAMAAAAPLVEGHHDFAAFQAAGSNALSTERDIFSSRLHTLSTAETTCVLGGSDVMIIYEITGSGFLRYMVRGIVGTLVEIGRGRYPSRRITDVLASGDRGLAGPTAPPEGLFLVCVTYAR
jgi:tRNA pseudouridine38-40 synthase